MDVADFPNAVRVSALTGEGLDELRDRLGEAARASSVNLTVRIPYAESELVSLFHRRGAVLREAHEPDGTRIEGTLPAALAGRYDHYRVEAERP